MCGDNTLPNVSVRNSGREVSGAAGCSAVRDTNPRAQREDEFVAEHRRSKFHANADALSPRRCPSDRRHCTKYY
ncbi:hypothetical protein EVAR_75903_1 [Eumeta japonica]|uniref:Uncharacterized protein n=1 Tax=Eumeta variegata TaxID=151549 RepID=A0A4C1UXH5_EUMVA|nr:hypothetical protein EVAR_75903_1 [Eumeta japonica]